MADTFNFDFFQVPATGITENYVGAGLQQHRDYGQKMSMFGALNYGPRSADDYTRTVLYFKEKTELENPTVPPFVFDGAEYNRNPFVWGSTVKRIWNDEFTVMGLGSRRDMEADAPKFDVSDTNVTNGPFVAPRNYPTEGWHSFGGRTAGPANYVAPGQQIV